MTMPGAQNSGALQAWFSVFWTNRSNFPPSIAFCSGPYEWFCEEVSAWEWVSRCGLNWFGLLVSSGPTGPLLVMLVYSPFTVGVPGFAWNGVPSVFAANGYVPK